MSDDLLPAPGKFSATHVIYKYRMTDVTLRVPIGVVRHIAAQFPQDELPTIWIEHPLWALEPGPEDKSEQEILMVGTGHPFHPSDGSGFLGSAVCASGALVWHVYSRMVYPDGK